eukprot:CAMPEP_0182582552 /NCGR_PEP_ID=MMETSP1324-20130603/52917_1 /TAXON_ID=236786 /ORGANISM="Florenciella sp., Strain RCC1587" /LENGTH=37 /DNA_ID= /DNA_START= /DNA_END= /DNA_ORIENTATION=
MPPLEVHGHHTIPRAVTTFHRNPSTHHQIPRRFSDTH